MRDFPRIRTCTYMYIHDVRNVSYLRHPSEVHESRNLRLSTSLDSLIPSDMKFDVLRESQFG